MKQSHEVSSDAMLINNNETSASREPIRRRIREAPGAEYYQQLATRRRQAVGESFTNKFAGVKKFFKGVGGAVKEGVDFACTIDDKFMVRLNQLGDAIGIAKDVTVEKATALGQGVKAKYEAGKDYAGAKYDQAVAYGGRVKNLLKEDIQAARHGIESGVDFGIEKTIQGGKAMYRMGEMGVNGTIEFLTEAKDDLVDGFNTEIASLRREFDEARIQVLNTADGGRLKIEQMILDRQQKKVSKWMDKRGLTEARMTAVRDRVATRTGLPDYGADPLHLDTVLGREEELQPTEV